MRFKFSIILICHNESRWLIDWVNKMAIQEPDEFIIVDNASTDNSQELIHNLQKLYPKIRVIYNHENSGPFGGFILGAKISTNDFVACMSPDDEPKTDYVSKMRQAIKDYPLVDAYTCNTEVEREGLKYERVLFPFTAYISPDYAVKILKSGLSGKINLIGLVIRKELLLRLWEEGGKDLVINFDGLYSYFAIFDKGFVNIGEKLMTYRSFPNSWGSAGNKSKLWEARETQLRLFRKYPQVYKRVIESNLTDPGLHILSYIALWGIMKLPKWLRLRFYKWLYSTNWRINKL
jgi:glycosyltransferase involved in cell wall biosynthesis